MPEFEYKEMLNINTPHTPTDDDLNRLAAVMTEETRKVPAGYVYLGQFIDHDIALDSSTLEKLMPWSSISPSSIKNKRSPFLNLETIYGSDFPNDLKKDDLLQAGSRSFLRMGDTVADNLIKKSFTSCDLPRENGSPSAAIVDKRNDENLIVAQTQAAFMKFHNTVVKLIGGADTDARFEEARKTVILHYQWIVLKDFLPKVIKQSVLNDVLTRGNQFYFPDPVNPYMPLEFSAGAYRFGHCMVKSAYNWNRYFNESRFPEALPATLVELTKFTGKGGGIKSNLPSVWLINWNWFFNNDNSQHLERMKFNFAAPINTKIPFLLGLMNPKVNSFDRQFSLAALDLYRLRALGVPCGQAVAEKILGSKEKVLKPEQIANLLPDNLKSVFSKETPLWFYLLAEAEIEERGQTLGEVGSRIVAETFVGLMKISRPSILRGNFQPNPDFCRDTGKFGMSDLLQFIARNNADFDELNPLGEGEYE